ncbi:acyl-CoA-binding protein [Flavobacterium aurantiibacter]|uniref:Phosphatidylserine decarboxylase n=1 Tax=Flavobacterium aurantiibacter TaxID=2023067 RepID=A0A255ZPD1_9FLAO|nr:acyl-CoA-binding protein [Flavobacterium aurantiibacter]OYQ42774.1 phosphatidylserine decarboxylase [Flavobacterium aurantiibacter]
MSDLSLEERFQQAFQKASEMRQADLPPDVQLRLYSFYKQATFGNIDRSMQTDYDLRNAFKTNAWMQIRSMSVEDAMKNYIQVVEDILKSEL